MAYQPLVPTVFMATVQSPDVHPLTILSLAILAVLIARNLVGRKFHAARLFIMPLVVGLLGIAAIAPLISDTTPHAVDYIVGGLGLLDSLIIGGIRGFTVKLYKQDGILYYRYTPITVVLWCVSIGIRAVLSVAASMHGATLLIQSADVLLMLALSVLVQNIFVLLRVRRTYSTK